MIIWEVFNYISPNELLLHYILINSRKNRQASEPNTSSSPTPLAFDGPYDLTITGTKSNEPSTDYPVYADPTEQTPSSAGIYHDIPESTTDGDTVAVYSSVDGKDKNVNPEQISVLYAKPQKDVGKIGAPVPVSKEESLYYASSNRQDPEGQEGEEGREDNAAYSSDNVDDVQSERECENQDGGDTEGWEDNSLYATKNDDEDRSEWVDNDIYAGSDEESQ